MKDAPPFRRSGVYQRIPIRLAPVSISKEGVVCRKGPRRKVLY